MPSGDVIAIFDLDGTIMRRDTYAAYLLGYLRRHPPLWRRLPALALALARAAHRGAKAATLNAVFGGMDVASIEGWNDQFVPWCLARLLRADAATRIATHRRAGHRLLMATASLDLYVHRLARELGFDQALCTRAAWTREGRLAGTLDGGNLKGAAKLAAVQRALSADRAQACVIAYSDHHSDLPLLRWADRAVAVCPSAALAAAATAEGFVVESWA